MPVRARPGGGAVHTVLAVFSLGLLATSVLFDVVGLLSGHAVWAEIAVRDLLLGLVTGVASGALSLAALVRTAPASSARPAVVLRATAQGGGLALFGSALALRRLDPGPFPSPTALVLSAAALALGAIAVWLTLELAGRTAD